MAPPRNCPSAVTASTVVAVPTSMTTAPESGALILMAAEAAATRSIPRRSGSVTSTGSPKSANEAIRSWDASCRSETISTNFCRPFGLTLTQIQRVSVDPKSTGGSSWSGRFHSGARHAVSRIVDCSSPTLIAVFPMSARSVLIFALIQFPDDLLFEFGEALSSRG